MNKFKEQMMGKGLNPDFQMMQKALFEDMVENGSPNIEFPPLSPFALGGDGLKAGNNFFSPSTTRATGSVASKPETLILNAQARQNTTTKEKKLKATPYTPPQFYWNETKKCLEEIKPFQFEEL